MWLVVLKLFFGELFFLFSVLFLLLFFQSFQEEENETFNSEHSDQDNNWTENGKSQTFFFADWTIFLALFGYFCNFVVIHDIADHCLSKQRAFSLWFINFSNLISWNADLIVTMRVEWPVRLSGVEGNTVDETFWHFFLDIVCVIFNLHVHLLWAVWSSNKYFCLFCPSHFKHCPPKKLTVKWFVKE